MKSEALHTAPHHVAPHPEWWTAPDSDSTECEVTELIAAFVRAIQPEVVIETGTAYGYTSAAIGEALLRNGHGKLYTLEPDNARRKFAQDLADEVNPRIKEFVEFLPTKSLDFTPPGQIQFALFDSLYQLRVDEFMRYKPYMKPGTIVTMHDWTSGIRKHHIDIKKEIETRLVKPKLAKAVYVPSPRGLAVLEVL